MTEDKDHQFVRYIDEKAADALRGVIRYHHDDIELLYRRHDIDGAAFEKRLLITLNQATSKYLNVDDGNSVVDPQTYVELFDGVAAVCLRVRSHEGVLFSFDLRAAEKLTAFVDECRMALTTAAHTQESVVADDSASARVKPTPSAQHGGTFVAARAQYGRVPTQR